MCFTVPPGLLLLALMLSTCASPAACTATSNREVAPSVPETRDVTFTSSEGFVFDARIVVPSADTRNGHGVLLMGGGYGNSLNWTVPATLEMNGQTQQITISGDPHDDATLLAAALADRGFTVMHWSTIRHGDPKADRFPYEATFYPMDVMARHAAAALEAFTNHGREEGLFEPGRIVLLGHSLGGSRACHILGQRDAAALVLLSSAQLTRTGHDDKGFNLNREAAAAWLAAIDQNEDGRVQTQELIQWRAEAAPSEDPLADATFDQLDFDDDKGLRAWEVSAGLARGMRREMDLATEPKTDSGGLVWSEDVLRERTIPTLIVYGALDESQAYHAPIMAGLIDDEPLDHAELHVLAGLGHQLGPEQDGRFGPIDDRVLTLVADWLEQVLPAGQ